MTTKTCSKCNEPKPLDQFYNHKLQCKSCISKQRRDHYDQNADRIRARCRNYYNTYMKKPKQ